MFADMPDNAASKLESCDTFYPRQTTRHHSLTWFDRQRTELTGTPPWQTVSMEPSYEPSNNVPAPQKIAMTWWDDQAEEYLAEHPSLGEVKFQWGPEGWTEEDLHLLPHKPGRILEVGAGAAQCSRWLASKGHEVVATDISPGMLAVARALNAKHDLDFPLIAAGIEALPFNNDSFDTVFTSFGALSFLPTLTPAFDEVFRVLRPGGTWIYSVTHPFSWVFPDSPHQDDLTVTRPYGKREAYVETTGGTTEYAEFPHTFSDHVNGLVQSGFDVTDLFEPDWPAGKTETWGAWGPDRGAMLPGTLIVTAQKPARS